MAGKDLAMEEGRITGRVAYRAENLRVYERFNIQQRLQHATMFTSFILLAITGLPVKYAAAPWAAKVVALFGGFDSMLRVHLFGASMMIASCINHALYLVFGALVGDFSLAMVPTPKDVRDLMTNMAYQLGLSRQRPLYDRYSYKEKFDYWAVFWGIFIMVGSGLMMWFPEVAARYFPRWVIDAARAAHSDEAMLAIFAIFVWHFYNVHLTPRIFPMNLVWWHGRLTREEMVEEHPLELPRLEGEPRGAPEVGRGVEEPRVTM